MYFRVFGWAPKLGYGVLTVLEISRMGVGKRLPIKIPNSRNMNWNIRTKEHGEQGHANLV